jgi:transcriptional regulator with XRE-family HTH domain
MMTRRARKLTQKELARRIGTTNVKISRFENGIDIPKADILKKLAEELDVTMDYLIEGMETSPHIERKQMG